MRISYTDEIDGNRIIPLGKISAASTWHSALLASNDEIHKAKALHKLMRAAEDCDADAIIGVDYEVVSLPAAEAGSAPLKRVRATGVAVKLAAA